MSNDTTYSLKLRHRDRLYLKAARNYMKFKHARWVFFRGLCEKAEVDPDPMLLARVEGLWFPREVVSWGFEWGRLTREKVGWSVEAEAYANENAWNIPIAGLGSELHDLLSKYPDLTIRGRYRDECGSGRVIGSERRYRGQGRSILHIGEFIQQEADKDHLSEEERFRAILLGVSDDADPPDAVVAIQQFRSLLAEHLPRFARQMNGSNPPSGNSLVGRVDFVNFSSGTTCKG